MILSKETPSRNRIIESLTITIVLCLGMGLFIIYPSANRIKELTHEISQQKMELDNIYARGQNLGKTIKQYEVVKPKISELSGIYIKAGDELNLITQLEEAAKNTNVTLDKQLASNVTETDNQKILPLQLTVGSSFENLIKFIGELEGFDHYLSISSVRANRGTTSGLSTLLLTNAFYQP